MGTMCCKCFKSDNSMVEKEESLVATNKVVQNEPEKKMTINDFNIIKVIGKGSYAKVFLVQKK